jgi:hypothetical protein
MISTSGSPITIFAGRSNPDLGQSIAAEFGKELGAVTVKYFSDGEIYVRYEESIRGTDLFIIQSSEIVSEHRRAIQVIYRYVEEALYLWSVQIHGKHTIDTCCSEHIRHQFRSNRDTRLVFSLLPSVSEVGNDSCYTRG